MNCKLFPGARLFLFCCAALGLYVLAAVAQTQEVHHLSITQPGGMPGTPIITGIQAVTNGVKISWEGPPGYYQLWERTLATQPWKAVAGPTLSRSATVTGIGTNALFRVSGPAPQYSGSKTCAECHGSIYNHVTKTEHAVAFTEPEFIASGGQTNRNCLACHTVGFGLNTGFVSASNSRSTNLLAGVQCENCHAPAGNHAANPDDLSVKPIVDVASTVCGGCHTFTPLPTYTEWQSSGHAQVTEPDMNPNTCGRCHIGPARLAMLEGKPVNQTDTTLGVGCVVCHDPHQVIVHTNVLNSVVTNTFTGLVVTNVLLGATYTNQVRNPFASTNDYFLTTSDVFTNKYDPNINMCGQCHNHRGAAWQSTSRPPHHSPQYNILLGTVGVLPSGSLTNANNHQPGSHVLIEKQCVGCHMQMTEPQFGPTTIPGDTGHKFTVDKFNTCLPCHPFMPQEFAEFTMATFSAEIQDVKKALDNWALIKMGGMLGTNYYGALAWEYTNPGDLSSGTGPSTADQALIPDNIKKARFNLYLVLYDGSFGVHNGRLAGRLLEAASAWIDQAMHN
jgi:hypothetical protein